MVLKNRKNIVSKGIILIIAIGFVAFLYFFNQLHRVELVKQNGTSFEKAVVQKVIKDNLQKDGSRVGKQDLSVKILSGKLKGKVVNATSYSGYLYGADCTENMKVVISLSVSGEVTVASVFNYYREPLVYAFVALFVVILWLVGGKKGLKSAVSLIFTFICIIFLFIPMLYRGYSPFFAAVIICVLTTIVTMYFIDGFSIKTVAAILGTILGVIIAGAFAAGFGHFAKISGYNVAEVEELVFISNSTGLKVGGLLFAGILIASLGAVMDVSISIASTINEIYENNNQLSKKELFKSGINVGRDMMGTMSNTLILAFTGGSINTLILSYAYSMKYNQLVNMYSIGIEIMQGISGSIAIILTVPLVSFLTSEGLTNKALKKFLN